MQWSSQWIESTVWIARTFGIVLLGLAAVGAVLLRATGWGRQVRRLVADHFDPRRDWRPLALAAAVLLLSVAGVRLNLLLSFWNNGFYDSVQALDEKAFWSFMGLFALLASLHVLRVLLAFLSAQALDIGWRTALTQRLTDDWLAGRAYYRGRFLSEPVDNPDQRIQVDVATFVSSTRTLTIGAVDAVVSLVTFTLILWGLSGPLTVAGIVVPRAMVFSVYLYVLVVSAVAFWLGRPLIRLNFLNERLGANFRYALIRLREYAEGIAFHHGEPAERSVLRQRFDAVIRNVWAIVGRSMKFDGFNLAASQATVVFPFAVQAQRFFSGQIKLGDVMQTSQAFGQVADALSFFRLSYDGFAQYRAALDRLCGFLDANAAARALPQLPVQPQPEGLRLAGLAVQRPDGAPLLQDLSLQLAPGQALLVQGASGSGKTTLLRALAGLWPFAQGQVAAPTGAAAMFLPQRPYLPLGTLRDALRYPDRDAATDGNGPDAGGPAKPDAAAAAAAVAPADDSRLQAVLAQVQLGHLRDALHEPADWSQRLSGGEQQRLAIARVLVHAPRIVYLDESSSAMDEGLEHAVYALLRRELPDAVLVSVGHRRSLLAFHTHRLDLQGGGAWTLQPLADPGAGAADGSR